MAPNGNPSEHPVSLEDSPGATTPPSPYSLRCHYSFSLARTDAGRFERLSGTHASLKLAPRGDCLMEFEVVRSDVRVRDFARYKNEILREYEKTHGPLSEAERQNFVATGGSSYSVSPNVPLHAVDSEESAEVHQFRAFADHIRNGGTPRANVMVGLAAVIAGASARKSYEIGNPVDIDPAWMEFEFDTPSITDYDPDITAIEAED